MNPPFLARSSRELDRYISQTAPSNNTTHSYSTESEGTPLLEVVCRMPAMALCTRTAGRPRLSSEGACRHHFKSNIRTAFLQQNMFTRRLP